MYELSKRDLDGIDIELERYRTLDNKIYLRRQELIHNKKYSDAEYIRGQGKKCQALLKLQSLELKKTKHLDI